MMESYLNPEIVEAGCDEAGRGCLAGAVFAAAVILPKDCVIKGLNDSKKLTDTQRRSLRKEIEAKAIAWSVAEVSAKEIDKINILNASFLAMNKAVLGLSTRPEALLIDGNRFRTELDIPYTCVVKGDGKYASIAAASILAKTYRDDYIEELSLEFPNYGWAKNKAYPTKQHREAIEKHGITPYHRVTFSKKFIKN